MLSPACSCHKPRRLQVTYAESSEQPLLCITEFSLINGLIKQYKDYFLCIRIPLLIYCTSKPSLRRHCLCASMKAAHLASPFSTMHSSLAAFVSLQTQQMPFPAAFLCIGHLDVDVPGGERPCGCSVGGAVDCEPPIALVGALDPKPRILSSDGPPEILQHTRLASL